MAVCDGVVEQFFDLIDAFSYILAFMVFFGLVYRVVGTTMYQVRAALSRLLCIPS